MARTQTTLQGADSERFQANLDRVADLRGGAEPSNAELVRMMLDQFDPTEAVRNPDGSAKRGGLL
ncbi:hypothetical protein JCM30237_12340 [Halolamina litorea]|uniref:Uncharacterized protein n=1 Tax=Halolamina litorea TaxID=1515593 RepID=A0ABD6BLU0_9EURY|nr:hypothetical protein [Halolamina litorea]